MYIAIYCPDAIARAMICHHLIDAGDHIALISETEHLIVSLLLENKHIQICLLFDPNNALSLVELQQYLRQRRRNLRVRILPHKNGKLNLASWQKAINDALIPAKPRNSKIWRSHPRFKWRPSSS